MFRIFSDFHIHSKYSRATSPKMDIPSISRFAKIKGLNLLGTGDFTHPSWMKDLKSLLVPVEDTGLYKLKKDTEEQPYFIITGEVNTIFSFEGKTKKIHHLLLSDSLETAEQISDKLKVHGNLSSDGRPTLKMTASELVEEVVEVSRKNVIIPAHIWTPWYSLFGSRNGFNRIQDCYEDMTRHIFALETGLSSDPPMNWRLSSLDNYTLISNSDAHSPYPYRLGREANVLEIEKLSYSEVLNAIRMKDAKRFPFTIETKPAYGKYHWTGHRNCKVSMPSWKSLKLGGICPVCRKPMIKGVDERVENLADRPAGYRPEDAIEYIHLLPLHDIIGAYLGVNGWTSSSVWQIFNLLVATFGNEYSVVLDVPLKSLEKIVEPRIVETIMKVRNDEISVVPGYDGVYGEIRLLEEETNKFQGEENYGKQCTLEQFM